MKIGQRLTEASYPAWQGGQKFVELTREETMMAQDVIERAHILMARLGKFMELCTIDSAGSVSWEDARDKVIPAARDLQSALDRPVPENPW